MSDDHEGDWASPYVDMPRPAWAELAASTNVVLAPAVLDQVRGLGDPTSQADVQEVYHPLAELITQYARNRAQSWRDWNAYLGREVRQTPFVLAIAGSVAVGKSTVARLLAELLRRAQGRPRVDLVTTDGFLLPNAKLAKRGLLERKGFPESYDTRALLRFVMDVKSGQPSVSSPVYSHVIYDIVPGETVAVEQPDILVLEGLNVLQPALPSGKKRPPCLSVSDFIDFSVYVDADEADIKRWFTHRFLALRQTAFLDPASFFRQFAALSDDEAVAMADQVWEGINGPNLRQNIAPTRERATVILRKNGSHEVETVRIRRI